MKKLSGPLGRGGNHPPGVAQVEAFAGVRARSRNPERFRAKDLDVPDFAGDFTARVPPVPIPNTEVKPRWADGTARVSVWEIR